MKIRTPFLPLFCFGSVSVVSTPLAINDFLDISFHGKLRETDACIVGALGMVDFLVTWLPLRCRLPGKKTTKTIILTISYLHF